MSGLTPKKTMMHETYAELGDVEGPSNRAFGFTVGGILLAIAAIGTLLGGMPKMFALSLAGIGAPLVILGAVLPSLLQPLNFVWMKLGLLLGIIVTPILMFVIFILMFTPYGLVMRARGYDPLRLRKDDAEASYWVERDPPGPDPAMMAEQF